MNTMGWVAIIGAGAWIPQIIVWVQRAFTRPKVSLYMHSQPQIGYHTLGPMFNVTFALLSEKKDAILNKISATLKHENGATYTFDWAGLSEDISEIQYTFGPIMSVKKESLPLVVKVLHTGVAQVFVRFQYEQFRVNIRKASVPALDRFNYLKTSQKLKTEQDIEELISGQEFSEFIKLFSSEFIWSAGKYTVTFNFYSPNKFKYTKSEYTFELSQGDIDELKKNIDYIKLALTEAGKVDTVPDYEQKKINWVWRNPELRKKDNTKLQAKENSKKKIYE